MGYLVPKQTWRCHDLFDVDLVPKQTWLCHDLLDGQGILQTLGLAT
jgi:hypothetical protein